MSGKPTIAQHLLEFSENQSAWKQDILRRIVLTGDLTDADRAHAVAACQHAHELGMGEPPALQPLGKAHLTTLDGDAANAVSLLALRDFEGVNALLPGQSLEFSPEGLTVVFGYNGAGKSGYARVLKQLCRARGSSDPILPDAFAKDPATPKVTVRFREGAGDDDWTGALNGSDGPSPDGLAQIAVFDRTTGAAVLGEKQRIDLLPAGLDLLPLYKDCLEHVSDTLTAAKRKDTKTHGFPEVQADTDAGKFLSTLSAGTTESAITKACAWSEADDAALDTLIGEITNLRSNDPAKKARDLVGRATRLDNLAKELRHVENALSDTIADGIKTVREQLDAAQAAQAIQADSAIPADTLPGTGDHAWRLLWTAAREFSTVAAYPGVAFPNTADDARCVLCQQELDDDGRQRLTAFEAFVADKVSKQLAAAEKRLRKAREHLASAIPEKLHATELRTDDAVVGETFSADVDAFLENATARRVHLLQLLEGETTEPAPGLPPSPAAEATSKANQNRAEATALREQSKEALLKVKSFERKALEARKTLSKHQETLVDEVVRLQRAKRRERALKDCNTRTLSTFTSKMTGEFVTTSLAEAFNRELKALGAGHLRVEISSAGTSRGTSYTTLQLRDASSNKKAVASVFSEGEQRAVALAAFLAELDISPSRSAIVFDDPVTSMDHRWRRKIAERIARTAKERQVILFTHDAVFLRMLMTACGKQDAPMFGAHVERRAGKPGYCSAETPWEAKPVGARVGALKDRHVRLAKTHRIGTDNDYSKAVVEFADLLRKTWERAIEECLFNGAISRFEFGIETQRLRVVDLVPEDYPAIEAGMARCSAIVHDAAQSLQTPPPAPEEVAEMLNELIRWVQAMKARRPSKAGLPGLKELRYAP